MEPCDGSSLGDSFPQAFQQHRGGKNCSDLNTPDTSLIADSGYFTTLNNTPNFSSLSSTSSIISSNIKPEISTPQRSLSCSSTNLGTISEYGEGIAPDTVKLTPVTENIRNICNFHITTPKDEQYAPGTKRSAVAILNFQDIESTPKKPRVEEEPCAPSAQSESSSRTTPRKSTKFRSKRQSFRKKLASAPDLDCYFISNNIENENSPGSTNISPIFDKSAPRGSRTPLSSSSSNLLRASTPKSSNLNYNYGGASTGIYDVKPASVKKLLTFSDSQFEQLLRAEVKEDLFSSSTAKTTPPIETNRIPVTATATSSTKKCLAESFVRASFSSFNSETNDSDDWDDSIRPLPSITSKPSIDSGCDVSSEQASRKYRKIYSVTSTVLHDRELSRRQLSSSRVPLQRQFSMWSDESNSGDRSPVPTADKPINIPSNGTSKTTKKDKTETGSQGFQDILNINNDCHDMEISTIHEDSVEVSETEVSSSANYDIESSVDLALNKTIVCETKSMSPPRISPPVAGSGPPTASTSRIPLPRTPKKIKPTSVDHERLEILYPMIRRTPSKYNPLQRRAATKRKLAHTLSNTFKRRCKYYGGNTHLNIIAKLENYSLILDQIFRNLSPQDLANMCEVSQSWRKAVKSSRWAWDQVIHYLENCKSLKENDGHFEARELDARKEQSLEIASDCIIRKIPFNQSNLRIDRKRPGEINRSPPVSPSKRKFHENQKVVRTLAPNEKLLKCPRCNKSSRIYNALTLQTDHHNNNNSSYNSLGTSTNKSTHIRSLSETFHSTSNASKIPSSTFMGGHHYQTAPVEMSNKIPFVSSTFPLSARDNGFTSQRMRFGKSMSCDSASILASEAETSQYAECSGLSCGYRFCFECLCDYHPGTKCKLYEPSSPSKDDGQTMRSGSTSVGSRASIKNLRRKTLKRLCF